MSSQENQNLPLETNTFNYMSKKLDDWGYQVAYGSKDSLHQDTMPVNGSEDWLYQSIVPAHTNEMCESLPTEGGRPLAAAENMPLSLAHSNVMAPHIIHTTDGNSKRYRNANISQGTQSIGPSQTKEIVRKRNAKRTRKTSVRSSDKESIAKKQKVAHTDNIQQPIKPQQQLQHKETLQQYHSSVTSHPSNQFTIGFDDFSFIRNPAGAGIEFGVVCEECGVVCVTGAGLSAHQKGHRDNGFKCAFCPQIFLTRHGRDAHQQQHCDGQYHDVEDLCQCGICGGPFISVIYLELHLLELHGRESLRDPRLLHIGHSQKSSIHTEDDSTRPLYRCGICNMIFKYSNNLDCHMALHNNEVSYACSQCDAAYSHLEPLIFHSKIHQHSSTNPAPTGRIAAQQSMVQNVYPPTNPAPPGKIASQLNMVHNLYSPTNPAPPGRIAAQLNMVHNVNSSTNPAHPGRLAPQQQIGHHISATIPIWNPPYMVPYLNTTY